MKVTLNRLKIFEFIKNSGTRWLSISQIAHHTGVDASGVNKCLLLFTKAGLVVRNEMFHAYLYRLEEGHENHPLGKELAAALHVFHTIDMSYDDFKSEG